LLEQLRQSRTAAWRQVQRAQVLWLYYTGSNIATIMKTVKMTRKSVSKWIAKALTMGVSAGLKDTPHGSKPVLTENAKAWVVHLACSKPKELGYAAEVWSRQALAQHVRRQAVAEGHPSLARASKATIQRILNAAIPTSKARCETSCWCIRRLSCRIRDSFPQPTLWLK
jgi:transposase